MSAVELQKAIFTKLNAVGTYPVYDYVKADTAYPYIIVGDDTLTQDSADDFIGFDATVTIHSWSVKKGRKEIKTIQDYVFNQLNREILLISGYNMVNCYQEYSETFLDPDGVTHHGVQRYRVIFDKS